MKAPNFDRATRQHFAAWLRQNVPAGRKAVTRKAILDLLAIDPGLLEGRSWPEILALADSQGRPSL